MEDEVEKILKMVREGNEKTLSAMDANLEKFKELSSKIKKVSAQIAAEILEHQKKYDEK